MTNTQPVVIVMDKGGFYDTPITQNLDCDYQFKKYETLSKVRQKYMCGTVDIGEPVEQYWPDSVDTVVLTKSGERDVYITTGSYTAFKSSCIACCIPNP